MNEEYIDGTNEAHPAWWRGYERGVEGTVEALNKVLDEGEHRGTFGSANLEKLANRILRMASINE